MGVDYGDKRVGIALSDALQIIASAFDVIPNQGVEQTLEKLGEIIKTYNVTDVAFGLPVNMDGSEGERAALHREIGNKLQSKTGVNVHYIDERLTSYEAEQYLKEAKVKWEKRKELIDKISAQIILQTYMNSKK